MSLTRPPKAGASRPVSTPHTVPRWLIVFLLVLSTGWIAGSVYLHVYGAQIAEGTPWHAPECLIPAGLAVLITGVLWALVFLIPAAWQHLDGAWKWLFLGLATLFVLLIEITGNGPLTRAGFDRWAMTNDESASRSAELGAWEKTREDLQGAVASANADRAGEIAQLDRQINEQRQMLAELIASATAMDSDGNAANDRMIPAKLAEVESLKADLGNMISEKESLRKDLSPQILGAQAALAAHLAARGSTEASLAQAKTRNGSLRTLARHLAVMRGGHTEADSEAAYVWVVTMLAFVFALLQYAIILADCALVQMLHNQRRNAQESSVQEEASALEAKVEQFYQYAMENSTQAGRRYMLLSAKRRNPALPIDCREVSKLTKAGEDEAIKRHVVTPFILAATLAQAKAA